MFLTIKLRNQAKLFFLNKTICIKIYLALNNLQGWCAIKPNQPTTERL